jgi:hypothetical protein
VPVPGQIHALEKPLFNKTQKIASLVILSVFAGVHIWNSTHSLSLKTRTEQLALKQSFGFYQLEKTEDGMEFRWTRKSGGLTIKVEKPIIEIPLLASHPDIQRNPVKVKIFLVKGLFQDRELLDEVTLSQSAWKTYKYELPGEVGEEVILLVKVSRTWSPRKTLRVPDPRNLGVALGKVEFRDDRGP